MGSQGGAGVRPVGALLVRESCCGWRIACSLLKHGMLTRSESVCCASHLGSLGSVCVLGVQDLAPGHCCCCYCCGCCCRIVGQFVTQDPGKLLLWFYLLIFVVRVILPYCHCVVIDQLGGYLFLMYLVEFYAMLTSSDYGLGPLRECWQWPSSDGHHSGAKRDLQL